MLWNFFICSVTVRKTRERGVNSDFPLCGNASLNSSSSCRSCQIAPIMKVHLTASFSSSSQPASPRKYHILVVLFIGPFSAVSLAS